jgi:hypothetical protein
MINFEVKNIRGNFYEAIYKKESIALVSNHLPAGRLHSGREAAE